MVSSEYLDCELCLTDFDQASLSVAGRDYSGRPALDEARRQGLLKATLDPKQYGTLLFEALFPGDRDDLLAGYREGLAIAQHEEQRLRFRLHIVSSAPPELHDLHWELLYDPQKRLALGRSRDTAFSRFLSIPLAPGIAVVERPRLLVVISAPKDLADYELPEIDRDQMRQAIEKALTPLAELADCEFLTGPATAGRIRDRLVAGRFHILHLLAHGLLLPERSSASLVLEGEDQGTSFIEESLVSEIIEGDRNLRLVTLIACYGGGRTAVDPFSGLGPALVRQGIPAVTAMRREISVNAATLFTEHLYLNLARCGRIDTAANEARLQLHLAAPDRLEWGTPALFMRLREGLLWQVGKDTLHELRPPTPHGGRQPRYPRDDGKVRRQPAPMERHGADGDSSAEAFSRADSASLPPILYVDDEEHNLTVFEAAFERYYTVHTAASARQAIEILSSKRIHLIIADQRMPEMTGVQLLEVVVAQYPEVGRMILTGYVDVDAIINAINAGRVHQYVTKPWDEKGLKVIMDRELASYDLRMRNKRLMAELKQRAAWEIEIRKVFQKYVPAVIVNELLGSRNKDCFLGETRIVAVLFAGLRRFTALSARLTAQQLVAFLNRYFKIMTDAVSRHDGTVNKFIGDGIIAIFGAPVSSLNNAENAVNAALEMVEAVAAFNRTEAGELVGEEIRIGIGVNLGEVVAGNVGSDEKMEYTVVGDTVNVGARIEEFTKAVPNSILISQSVYDWTSEMIEVEALEPVVLRGRAEPTQLYRVLSRKAPKRRVG